MSENNTERGLSIAIQMEIDGKEFYLKASRKSSNELGNKLLQALAREEATHRQRFEEIYNASKGSKEWPRANFEPDGGKRLRTIFANATETMEHSFQTPPSETEAIRIAMDMENRSYDFYTSQSSSTTSAMEREFYNTIAGEEREHHFVLLDYLEFLKNPQDWFTRMEHHSLDG